MNFVCGGLEFIGLTLLGSVIGSIIYLGTVELYYCAKDIVAGRR